MKNKLLFGIITLALASCAESYHNSNMKKSTHLQKNGDASSNAKLKAKLHHKGGGSRFKFY